MIKQLFIIVLLTLPLKVWSNNNDSIVNVPFEERIEFHLNEIDSIMLIRPIDWAKVNETQLTLSSLYRNIGQYTMAMNAALEGIRISETYRNNEGIEAGYQDVANCLRYKGNFEEAHAYMRKAIAGTLKFKEQKKKENHLAYFYYQHSLIFEHEEVHLDSALYYHELSLATKEKYNNKKAIPQSHMSIGHVYYKLGNYDNALESLTLADSLYDQIKFDVKPNFWLRKKATVGNYIGLVRFAKEDYSNAIKHFRQSAYESELIDVKELLLYNYEYLANSFEQLKIMDSAIHYRNKFIALNEVVYDEKKDHQLEELKTIYEIKKKNEIIEEQKETIGYSEVQITRFIIAIVTLIFSIIFLTVFFRLKRLKAQRELQNEFSQDLINTIEKDRLRISRDLHDSIGQNLLIIKSQNSLLGKNLTEEKLIEKSASINTIAAQTIDELREISNNLTPYQLGRLGLTKAIEDLLQKFENLSQLNFLIEIENIDDIVAQDQQINVYRIIQESLNNIIKHAHCTEVTLKVSKSQIIIADNGVGFATTSKSHGMGLSNLATRSKLLSAEFSIDSSPNNGTIITIQFK